MTNILLLLDVSNVFIRKRNTFLINIADSDWSEIGS